MHTYSSTPTAPEEQGSSVVELGNGGQAKSSFEIHLSLYEDLVCYTDEDFKRVSQLNRDIEASILRMLYLDSLVPSEGNFVTIAAINSLCKIYVTRIIGHEKPLGVPTLAKFESLLQCYLKGYHHISVLAAAAKAHCISRSLSSSADEFTLMLTSVTEIGR